MFIIKSVRLSGTGGVLLRIMNTSRSGPRRMVRILNLGRMLVGTLRTSRRGLSRNANLMWSRRFRLRRNDRRLTSRLGMVKVSGNPL